MTDENKKDEKKCVLNIYFRVVNWLFNYSKLYIFLSVLISIVSSVLEPVSLVILQYIINEIQIISFYNSNLIFFIVLYFGIGFLKIFVKNFFGYYNFKFNQNIGLFIKNELLKKTSSLKLADFENNEIYNIVKRAEYVSEQGVIVKFYNYGLTLVSLIITTISYLFLLIKFKIWLLPIVVIIPLISYFFNTKLNLEQYSIIKKRTDEERREWYYEFLVNSGNSYKDLVIFDLFPLLIDKINYLNNKFINQDRKIAKKRLSLIGLFDLFEQIINSIIFVYIISLTLRKTILIGDFVTYNKLIISTKDNVNKMLDTLADLKKESLYIEQFYELMDINVSKEAKKLKFTEKIKIIKLLNVSYKYKNSSGYVLKNINMELKSDTINTIIGRNGSGKSTLIKIICGFYEDYEGDILINDINLRDIELSYYRKRISSLFQDFTKFEDTVRNNVSYGNVEFHKNDEILEKRLIYSGLDKCFIDKLPKYLDTQLGFWFDSGMNISGGQWQKIAIARAFIKECDVVFLDEPNSSLDTISEKEIIETWIKNLKSKIGVIITHRINLISKVSDNIFIIDDGNLIEVGNHELLMKKSKLYSEFVDNVEV